VLERLLEHAQRAAKDGRVDRGRGPRGGRAGRRGWCLRRGAERVDLAERHAGQVFNPSGERAEVELP
jgi:hypothetical protein